MTDQTDVATGVGVATDYLDGNMLAGPLREVFAMDVSAATGRCATCGLTGPFAALRVYSHAPGLVARCPGCDQVMLRLVRTPDSAWLDLRGATFLRLPMPLEAPATGPV
nr:DUF6510 family protein [Micromonospora sp. DSM 115978]